MKYNRLLVFTVLFAVFICISAAGSVSAASTAGNTSGNLSTSTHTNDTKAPTANANLKSGTYGPNRAVVISMNEPGNIYYTTNSSAPTSSSKRYTNPLKITSTTTLKFIAVDLAGNKSPVYTVKYTIDKTSPKASSSLKSGIYRTNQKITLKMNEKGSIYYTLNGSTPTKGSKKYTGTISVSYSGNLKFIAVDLVGNKSPVYTVKYTIDKTAPKVVSSTPKNSATVSRNSALLVKFSENIKTSVNWSKIYVKNLKTGKKITVSKTIKNNVLTIKTANRSASTLYQIYIPKSAVKDTAGNNLNKAYTPKFKTNKKLDPVITVMDKGNKTTYGSYSVGSNDALIFHGTPKSVNSWITYRYYNDNNVKMIFTKYRYKYTKNKYELNDANFVYYAKNIITVTITKSGSNQVKVTQSQWTSISNKTTTSSGYWTVKDGNAVNFYKSTNFKNNYLNMYIKY